MRHPTEGVLRRLVDEPAGVADADRRHVADCAQCLSEVASLQQDATLVGAALATAGTSDVEAGWQRLQAAAHSARPPAAHPARAQAVPQPRTSRYRAFLRRPAAAALGVAVVLAGAGTAAANDWVKIFRTEQVAPISFSTSDLVSLPDLEAYGNLEITKETRVRTVPGAGVAAAQSGLDVPEVAGLPRGVTGDPVYQVGEEAAATFTFSPERAAEAAAQAGEPLPPEPAGLDGSSVRLVAGPGVAQIWTSSSGLPALVVGRAVAPTAYSSGVPFETVRDYLLSLPGLPTEIAAQLRTFTADGSTLPLPVPSDQVSTRTEQVDGHQATVLTTRDRLLSAVVWVEDGVVTVVGGALDDDELLDVARGLT
ncbi:hypothetical protein [Motilibacter deserti]|uniref:DUF4367 domain-containing protein n=1 Tax=Motilibacter deserti TaxID=2714956 RepID=A0ABX0H0W3_9ACTN|nr:hypothetical protein [Motilibacter deserti]NHC15422.1 hypothetical protein [Motilibacter deserti]